MNVALRQFRNHESDLLLKSDIKDRLYHCWGGLRGRGVIQQSDGSQFNPRLCEKTTTVETVGQIVEQKHGQHLPVAMAHISHHAEG